MRQTITPTDHKKHFEAIHKDGKIVDGAPKWAKYRLAAIMLACASSALAASNPASAQSVAASPSPAQPSGLRTSVYTSLRDVSTQAASNNPGGRGQANKSGINGFAVLHANYYLKAHGWYVGGAYAYALPDQMLPETGISTILETYLGYKGQHLSGQVGNLYFTSPWATSVHRLFGSTPLAFQGAYARYATGDWTLEAADMVRFEGITASSFARTTLLTGYPIGALGLPSNIYFPCRCGVDTSGFSYLQASYAPKHSAFSADGYFYGMSDLLNMAWFDGAYALSAKGWKPSVTMQGGVEHNAGASYLGKIDSSVIGLEVSANPTSEIQISAGFDSTPWQRDTINVPSGVLCNSAGPNPTYQISTVKATLAYFLPQGTAQCSDNAGGSTNIYYGGWASPYSDSYANDPLFTTSAIEGMADRRSPGTASLVKATYTSNNKKLTISSSYAWYDYGNAAVPQTTTEWDVVGSYSLSEVGEGIKTGSGLLLRYFYSQQRKTNTAYGTGADFLGGLPLTVSNRIQLEYAF